MGMAGERECRGNGAYRHAASGADKRAVVGVLVGALVAVLSTRESHLLKYFKNR